MREVFEKRMQERQQFLDHYFVFRDGPPVGFDPKHGRGVLGELPRLVPRGRRAATPRVAGAADGGRRARSTAPARPAVVGPRRGRDAGGARVSPRPARRATPLPAGRAPCTWRPRSGPSSASSGEERRNLRRAPLSSPAECSPAHGRLAAAGLAALTCACGSASTTLSSSPVLPLRTLRLYETGVGYFERSGTLAGDRASLPVPAGHLDDALKTLVVLGPDGKSTRCRASSSAAASAAGWPARSRGSRWTATSRSGCSSCWSG